MGRPMPEIDVLVAGSINTDLVVRVRTAPAAGETVTGTGFAIFGGGKGANQAVAAARSGASVAMLGAVGDDDFGRQRLLDLTSEGVIADHVGRADTEPSGVALILVEEHGENRISYVPGATTTVQPEAAMLALAGPIPTVVLATLELPIETLKALFATAQERGATVIFNATPEPATGRQLLPHADILIVNETEGTELLGREVDPDGWGAAARELLGRGPTRVVVTIGERGAVVATVDGITRIPAPRLTVVDTTGAGDAFCGAMAARIAEGAAVTDAARSGVVAGSLAVTKSGAQPSMPGRHEIDGLLNSLASQNDDEPN